MFDRIVCLCLDKRNQIKRIQAEFKPFGIVQPFICGDGKTLPSYLYDRVDTDPPARDGYPAWKNRPNSYNAFCCYREIIEQARADKVETLLLLEDDAILTPDYAHILPAAIEQLPSVWDAFYLGANHAFSKTTQAGSNLLRLQKSGCWHAVCLHQRVFDRVLSLPMTGPIDGVFAEHVQKDGNCYAVWPNLVLTQPGFSYCEGREVDYSHFWSVKGC